MAVTRKPKPTPGPDEKRVEQLINKGGSVATARISNDEPALVAVLLRIPSDMLAHIDASVKRRRPVRISRLAWIIEALQERLERDEKDIK